MTEVCFIKDIPDGESSVHRFYAHTFEEMKNASNLGDHRVSIFFSSSCTELELDMLEWVLANFQPNAIYFDASNAIKKDLLDLDVVRRILSVVSHASFSLVDDESEDMDTIILISNIIASNASIVNLFLDVGGRGMLKILRKLRMNSTVKTVEFVVTDMSTSSSHRHKFETFDFGSIHIENLTVEEPHLGTSRAFQLKKPASVVSVA
jgi:hypothetical protein